MTESMRPISSNILDISEFASEQKFNTGRLIGLDLGTKTIGLAISDLSQSVASAREVIIRKKFNADAQTLVEFEKTQQASAYIIGLPINMDGSEGPRAQATRAFVRNMSQKTDLSFIFWDERLSTVSAERTMIEADISRKKRAERIDAVAATIILQGALDRINYIRTSAANT